ncbi:MAG: hypothetical protein L0K41_07130 [Yaniella sp.]|uniref:Uncharacterized protein n=1 Tax=Glutamicibacter arilaitensis (strain DSM 16368 / CIP 108037 / IAM 15318 / JCM 13566 / NCIMB 14258 / Re117) TaxID=861360 RepID=A0ABP1TZX7_GLUAR|nr:MULTISPECIES: hypothetical protein [Micrococcaceae]MDN5816128.1 hypothetical protein [Yaniella sp.]MDN5818212.1 hypothetical protein [Yaniella sp.]MDN5838092.1 hypothetical protein [Yaniella sp.]MDN5889104.1 hypothetical protein [Yaniella sp.]MDN5912240.1 hypothetical protein [Yaniella sp.]
MSLASDAALSVQLSKLAAAMGAALPAEESDQSPEIFLHSVATFGDIARVSALLQAQAVSAAQESGLSWAKIGNALGISRQAAQQRFDSRRADAIQESPAIRIVGPVSRDKEIEQINAAGKQNWKLIKSLHGEHVLELDNNNWQVKRVSIFSLRPLPSASEGWVPASTRFPDCFYVRKLGS